METIRTQAEAKNDIANQINARVDGLGRILSIDLSVYDIEDYFKEGDLYDNWGNAESWLSEGDFQPMNDGAFVFLQIDGFVDCHKVDYENEEEIGILGAIGCEDEYEHLIPSSQKFIITSVSTDEDFEEMGYYSVKLKPV